MEPKICHELIANVKTGSYVVNPPLEIPQGDCNSHQIIIKLINGEGQFVSLQECSQAKITWVNQDGITIQSSTVKIVNPYRGVLSYIVGPALVRDKGRYTAYLDIKDCCCDCTSDFSVTFVITIVEKGTYDPCPGEIESTVSKWFLNKVDAHMENTMIHLSPDEKSTIDQFIDENGLSLISQIHQSSIVVDSFKDLLSLPDYSIVEGKVVKVNLPSEEDLNGTDSIIVTGPEDDYNRPMYFELSGSNWIQNEFLGMTMSTLIDKINGLSEEQVNSLREELQDQIKNSSVTWNVIN